MLHKLGLGLFTAGLAPHLKTLVECGANSIDTSAAIPATKRVRLILS
jgi:hypothetical protein